MLLFLKKAVIFATKRVYIVLMNKKPRHEQAVEAIDNGLAAAERISVEDGIRDAIEHGRMTYEEGQACIAAYRATRLGSVMLDTDEKK